MPITRRDACIAALVTALPRAAAAADQSLTASAAQRGPRVIEARAGEVRLAPEPAKPTPILGYDGITPGPLLRMKAGEALDLRLVNKLDEPTAIHWQGVRIANIFDGAAGLTQAPVAPGETFPLRLAPPDSGLFFYRASAPPFCAAQVARGLAGALIVDEPNPPAVDRELLVVLQDWRLDANGAPQGGALDDVMARGEGPIGATVTVGAVLAPQVVEAKGGERVRLRVLNACVARLAGLILEGFADAKVIAVDGQPCDPFPPARHFVPSAPGSRFDLIVDLPADTTTRAALVLRGGGLRAETGGEADRDLLVFHRVDAKAQTRGPITGLALNPALPAIIPLQNAKRLDLAIERGTSHEPGKAWTLNGVAGSPAAKPVLSVPRGQPVTLGFINKSDVAHAMHVHGHVMRVLHLLDDGWEPYWRDTVVVPPGKTARVAFIADNPGKWLIESTILTQAVAGSSCWFEVK